MKLPAGWIENSRELGERPRALSLCEGPREWGVPICDYSLTSHIPSILEQALFQSSTEVAEG